MFWKLLAYPTYPQNDAQAVQNSMKMNPQTNLAAFIFLEFWSPWVSFWHPLTSAKNVICSCVRCIMQHSRNWSRITREPTFQWKWILKPTWPGPQYRVIQKTTKCRFPPVFLQTPLHTIPRNMSGKLTFMRWTTREPKIQWKWILKPTWLGSCLLNFEVPGYLFGTLGPAQNVVCSCVRCIMQHSRNRSRTTREPELQWKWILKPTWLGPNTGHTKKLPNVVSHLCTEKKNKTFQSVICSCVRFQKANNR